MKRVSLQPYAMALVRTMHGVCSYVRFAQPHPREAPAVHVSTCEGFSDACITPHPHAPTLPAPMPAMSE